MDVWLRCSGSAIRRVVLGGDSARIKRVCARLHPHAESVAFPVARRSPFHTTTQRLLGSIHAGFGHRFQILK
jgi:hypothetical protein